MTSIAAAAVPDPRRWRALAVICVAFFMTVLDVSIVNVALPSIQSSLHFSETGIQWVVTAYAITFGGFLLLGGRTGDVLGRTADVHGRHRRLLRRLARVRARHGPRDAGRGARSAGSRRRADLAGHAGADHDHLRGGRRAQQGARDLGRDGRRRRRGGRALRRDPHQVPGLGVDLLRERAGGRARARTHARPRAREPCGLRQPELRRHRGGGGHRRQRAARVRHLQGADRRLGLCADGRLARARGGAARLLRDLGGAHVGPVDAAADLPRGHGGGGERGLAAAGRRRLLELPAAHVLRAERARLLGAGGGRLVPGHGRHRRAVGRARPVSDHPLRAAPDHDRRLPGPRRRDALVHADPARRALLAGPPAGLPARRVRPGLRVHPGVDRGAGRRGPPGGRAGVGDGQHVAAARRRDRRGDRGHDRDHAREAPARRRREPGGGLHLGLRPRLLGDGRDLALPGPCWR